MADDNPKYNPRFEAQAQGFAVGDNNIIYNYNYFGYREEVVSAAPVDATDDNLLCPYRGLYHFNPNDAEYFFGRDVFIETLFEATQTSNFIPVLGASGSGKSSVVLAGLVPKLEQEQKGHWKFTHFRPGSDPFHALALALVPLYTTNLDDTEQIAQTRKLAGYLNDNTVLLSLPIHIAFLHLIIDPACSVVFEAEPPEAEVMKRPPRNPKIPLFNRQMLRLSVLQGVGVLVVLLAIFAIALYRGQGELDARALAFTTLIVANLSLILTNRSWSRTILATVQTPNPALWWVITGAIAFMGLVLYLPPLRHLFRFSILHPIDLTICLVGGVASVLWFEWLKGVRRTQGGGK